MTTLDVVVVRDPGDVVGESRDRSARTPVVPVAARAGAVATTRPRAVRELGWLTAAAPLWWALGVEQGVWALGVVVVGRDLLFTRDARVRVPPTARWLLALVVVAWASAFRVEDDLRWVTLLQHVGAYATAALTVLVVVNGVRRWADVRFLLRAVAVAAAASSALGLLAATGAFRPVYASPVSPLLPARIRATEYGGLVAGRSLGFDDWFTGVGEYFRLTGVALYPNQYATLLAVVVPVLVFLAVRERSWWVRAGSAATAVAATANLLMTTSRVATVSLVVGAVALVAGHLGRARPRTRAVVLVVAVAATAGTLAVGPGVDGALDVVDTVNRARGTGSLEGRSAVYEVTAEEWLERPVLGWGTVRDRPGLQYPAGSHSHYLGVLYAHGLLGLAALGLALATAWRDTRPGPRVGRRLSDPELFLRYGRWVLVTAALDGVTNDPALDGTTMFALFLLVGALLATRQVSHHLPEERS